jgi:hypothetical protein
MGPVCTEAGRFTGIVSGLFFVTKLTPIVVRKQAIHPTPAP